MNEHEDTRLAKELAVGQRCRLVSKSQKHIFVVISVDRINGSPFSANNVRIQRIVRKKLLGILPLGWKKVGLVSF